MAIIGIDLGTTNSVCAVWKDGETQFIPNRYGDYLTPSVVYLDEQQRLVIGKHAKEKIKTEPERAASVFKRAMGTDMQFELGKRTFNAIELSSLIIQVIKDDAEKFLGEPVTEAIISVPAYFNDHQRKATKVAAEMAGLKVDRLINEPTAAAMAYGLHEKPEDTRFMVLDLGGGTFDVSIMEYFDDILEVHASAGNNFLGGEDFLETFTQKYLEKIKRDKKSLNAAQVKQLYAMTQKALHTLSTHAVVEIPPIFENDEEAITISREAFNEWVIPLLDKMRAPMEQALKDAEMRPDDLDQVVLVGGATRMPVISSLVAKLFRKMPVRNIDPDLVVAVGTSIQAGLCERDEALEDVVLTDVCPYSLGVGIVNEAAHAQRQGLLFSPIIERNNVIPVSKVSEYCTASDNQTEIKLMIYQGESRLVKNNVYLGEVEIKVPKAPRGEEAVDVRFSYDMNGLLEVDVTVLSTKKTVSLVIDNSAQKLSDADIKASQAKLAKLKFHPRDEEVNKHLLLRAEKLYESSKGDLRQHLSNLINQFESVLERQDTEEIAIARAEIEKHLDEMESQNWFD